MIRLIFQSCRNVKPLSHGNLFSTTSHRPISALTKTIDAHSLTVSYLQKSCGFSLESAISASQKLHIDTTDKPDAVLKLFRTHGLTQTQINNLIRKRPLLLSADLANTLEANLKLLESLGFTCASLTQLLDKNHRILEIDANATVKLFRTNGFTDSQIKSITMKRPKLYLYNAVKCLKPKLEYFMSLGFSEFQMAKVVSSQPYILGRSLEKHIIPCIQVLRRILDSDENVLKALRAGFPVLEYNVEKMLEPKVAMLVNHGIPKLLVLKLLLIQPRVLLRSTDQLDEIIGEVKKLGLAPTNFLFILAIRSMAIMSKASWEKKLEAYMSFGLTKDEIYSAFKKQPMCMMLSDQKIRKMMDFFLNKLNMDPSVIFKCPNLLLFSLEKRVFPRCSVLQVLLSKEAIKDECSLPSALKMSEKQFLERFVKKYEHKVPEVVKAHQGTIKINFSNDLSSIS